MFGSFWKPNMKVFRSLTGRVCYSNHSGFWTYRFLHLFKTLLCWNDIHKMRKVENISRKSFTFYFTESSLECVSRYWEINKEPFLRFISLEKGKRIYFKKLLICLHYQTSKENTKKLRRITRHWKNLCACPKMFTLGNKYLQPWDPGIFTSCDRRSSCLRNDA